MDQSPQDKIQQGFSSQQQQIKPQHQLIYQPQTNQKTQPTHKQQIKFKLPPPQQIKNKKYSLHPDIVTGWQPKISLPSPVPIIFQSPKYDNIIKRLCNKVGGNGNGGGSKLKLCFLGPKYQNTYYAWYDKQFNFPYTHIKSPHSIKFSQRPFCGQHWDAENEECLKFDSFFQSGNLDCAVKVGQLEYDLFMRVDSNTRGHLQWYNFKIKNLIKNQQYKINICNFQKKKILYDRGLKPYILSQQKLIKQKISWQQSGQSITYQKKPSKTFKNLNIQSTNKHYQLSFTISTTYQNDQLQIAYCIPYTYCQLKDYLQTKIKQLQNKGKEIMKINKLCYSLGGLDVPLVEIHEDGKEKTQSTTNDDDWKVRDSVKKCVIVCARAHPGESNGSYMMQGFLDYLLSDQKQAQFLRRHIIFKIVPMINPDGVALGNYRTGLSGRDFNREYKDPDKQIFPQVYSFKQLVLQNKIIFKDNLQLFLDFHGHSVKKNTFTYGPQFVITNKFYYQSRVLPKLISKLTPMFRYHSCSFKIAQCKSATARAILLKKLNIPLAYTIETSNGFYFDYEKLKDIPYTDFKWKLMGQKVCQGVYQYIDLVVKSQMLRFQKLNRKIKQSQQHNGNNIVTANNLNTKRKDIHIRKAVGIRSSSQNNNKSHNHHNQRDHSKNEDQLFFQKQTSNNHSILQQICDQTIKSLFEQIKSQQQSHIHNNNQNQINDKNNKCSDDELSQGSSDSQGQQDDLSSKQLQKLFKCIKNKKFNRNLDKCRLSPMKNRTKTDQLEKEIVEIEDGDKGIMSPDSIDKQMNNRMSQEFLGKKRSHHMRKDFIFNLIESKKISNTPKVINFSFGFTPQKRGQFLDQRQRDKQKSNIIPNSKVNIFEAATIAKRHDMMNLTDNQMHLFKNDKNRFTDLIFRKTFNHSAPKDTSFSVSGNNHKDLNKNKKQFTTTQNVFSTTNYGYKFSSKTAQKQKSTKQDSQLLNNQQLISTCQTFHPSNLRGRSSRFQNQKIKKSFVMENVSSGI